MNIILPTLNSKWKDIINSFTIKEMGILTAKCLDDGGHVWYLDYDSFVKRILGKKLKPLNI